jgi:hypothetical protein
MTDQIRPSDDRAAMVDSGYFWRKIDASTPTGVKIQLVNRAAGVAVYGTLGGRERFFTHWAPLPKFPEE